MSDLRIKPYEQRLNRAFKYIDDHLDEPISVDQLSEAASFSKFHFHRQFSEYAGINVMSYIRMVRLKRASYRLVFHKQVRIIDIALEACFENPESFSRAFKKAYSQTPSQFRKKPKWKPWEEQFRFPEGARRAKMDVKIVNFKETKVALLKHRAAPGLVNDTAMKFIEWRKESGLSPIKLSHTYGIAYDDPETTEPAKFRFDICGSVKMEIPENNTQGVTNGIIPGGRCAVVQHLGSHHRIGESARYLYGKWLLESGEELRDFPIWFHYLNLFPEVPEHELVTDIYMPLR